MSGKGLMPDKKDAKEGEVVNSKEKPKTNKPQMSEAFQAGMLQVFGEQESYKPTKSQVDKILSLQEKGMDYTHKERTMYQPKQVMDFGAFIVIVLFIAGIIWLVLTKAPQYSGELVTSIMGFIGGGGLGYSYGVKKANKSDE